MDLDGGKLPWSWLGIWGFPRVLHSISRRKLGTKLLQSEERWTATLGSIGEAVIATDSEARVTFLNSVAATLTGWQPEEALNQPIQNVLKLINEQTGMTADNEVLRVLKEKTDLWQ